MLDGLNTYWWLLGLAAVAVVFFFVLSAFSGWRQARRDRRADQVRREMRPPPDVER
ncbi:hypothetical protein [Phenylobacterium zucineum]|uniref:hypothetical protein n=1 Tax=Phenylobacterium zucineum TaxID=284016 RepID=UPI0002F1E2EC|nr:hypothetical protein [Phenylobacterium zucineum]